MGNDDLHIKTEMSDGFIAIHELHLRARSESLRAYAFSVLEDAAWTDAVLAWTRAMQSGENIPKIASQGEAWIEKLREAHRYHAKKNNAVNASRRFCELFDRASPDEIWTEKTIEEYRSKFGKNSPIADKIMRRITSLTGEREAINAMMKLGGEDSIQKIFGMDASDSIKHIDGEITKLMDGLSRLKNGGADDGKSK